ncbi:MAG: class I SAM-dependent methyltransferase [Planctomycetota bacterium]
MKEVKEPDWQALRNRPLGSAEKRNLREFYASSYHDGSNYTNNATSHELIFNVRTALLQAVFPVPGRVLDAGCSAGGMVRAMRRHGLDAWGFDVCPDLHDIAYPEARDHVRIGGFADIPFGPNDGFRTLVSYDVFEHVPIDELSGFPAELGQLGIENVSCVIANDTITKEHITIQDTDWYVHLFAREGYRLMDELSPCLNDMLLPLPVSGGIHEQLLVPYLLQGKPRNRWNAVPGFLFFTRDD